MLQKRVRRAKPSSHAEEPVQPTEKKRKKPTRFDLTIYRFQSRKNNKTIEAHGWLEYALCFVLEYMPEVAAFEDHPQLSFLNGAHLPQRLRYTPDFLVRFVDQDLAPLCVEAKPSRHMNTKRMTRIRTEFAQKIRSNGFEFEVWNEDKAEKVFINNLRMLYENSYFDLLPDLQSFVETRVSELGEASIRRVVEGKNTHLLLQAVYNLIFRGQLECELRRPITLETKVRLAKLMREVA